jgi:GT2 family glycosyltransferase
MLQSLASQTSDEFHVIVVNDGSSDEQAVSVFEAMTDKYKERGWQFISTPNGGLSAARNHAVALSNAEYLIFLDGDDIAAPELVEHFLAGIRRSGDDCLTCYYHVFIGEGNQPSFAHHKYSYYTPTGSAPLLGLVGENPFGGASCIVRRAVFDAVGGFTTDVSKYVGYEDYEFYARLVLSGFRLDVLPEVLLYYRWREDGMQHVNDLYQNKARVLRVYEERLRTVGLEGLAYLAAGAAEHSRNGHTPPVAGAPVAHSTGPAVASRQVTAPAVAAPEVDLPFLVNWVSGHLVLQAMQIKFRNQIARKLNRRLKLS